MKCEYESQLSKLDTHVDISLHLNVFYIQLVD